MEKAMPTPDEPTAPRIASEKKSPGEGKRVTAGAGQARHTGADGTQPQLTAAQAPDGDSSGPGTHHRGAEAVMDRASGMSGTPRGESAAPQSASPAATPPRALPADIMQRITDKAVAMVKNGQDSIKIQLNPVSLGHIHLKVAAEGHQVMIRMLVENPGTRDLLEGNMGQLRAELGQQGLTVDRLDLDLFSSNTTSGQSGNQADTEAGSHSFHHRQASRQSLEKASAVDTTATEWDVDNGSTLVGVFA